MSSTKANRLHMHPGKSLVGLTLAETPGVQRVGMVVIAEAVLRR